MEGRRTILVSESNRGGALNTGVMKCWSKQHSNTPVIQDGPYYPDSAWGLIITSIRRLIALPSAVLLEAKGRLDP